MQNLADLRKTYARGSLAEEDVHQDPMKQFEMWFEQASKAQCPEPHAMTLATVNNDGSPSARIVLLKGIIEQIMSNHSLKTASVNKFSKVFCAKQFNWDLTPTIPHRILCGSTGITPQL